MDTRQVQTTLLESPLVGVSRVLVHSNLFISMAATSVAISTILLAELQIDVLPLCIVFSVTFFVYSFNRLTDLEEDRTNVPRRATFVQQYGRLLLAVGTVLYGGVTSLAIASDVPGAPAMTLPLVVALLYSVFGLKRVFLVKNVLVGLSWGLIPLGVGVYYGALLTVDVLFLSGFITASITIAAAVFDIKDIEGDRSQGIHTVPIRVGPRRTRQFAIAAAFVLGLGVVGLLLAGVLGGRYAALLIFLGYVIGYSAAATPERSSLFYGFLIDGEHLVLAVTLVFFEFVASP